MEEKQNQNQNQNQNPDNTQDANARPRSEQKLYTRKELNAIVARQVKLARERGETRKNTRDTRGKQNRESTPDTLAELEAYRAEIETMRLRQRFDRLALKAGLDDDAADDLFELYKVQKPKDPAAWLAEKAQRFGFSRRQEAARDNNETNGDRLSDVRRAPISDKGTAAPGVRDIEFIALERPWELTRHDIERLREKKGQHAADLEIRQRINAWLKTIKVAPPRRL